MNTLKKRCDTMWKTMNGWEEMTSETVRAYAGDKMYIHPCGEYYHDDTDYGPHTCDCFLCEDVRLYCLKRELTIREGDFPNMATHRKQSECGYTLYRGVIVQWDEDHDERIYGVIDEMPDRTRNRLLIAQEHEGTICFVWAGYVPKGYTETDVAFSPDGDVWSIYSSVALTE